MSKWSTSLAHLLSAFWCLACLGQLSHAADFVVANRDAVLELTSKIQATQFLTHATFGPTQAEVDQLASEMRQFGTVAAASAWIDKQQDEAQTPPVLHLPKIHNMLATDYPFFNLTLSGNATGVPPNSSNAPGATRYRQFAWWDNVIRGQDQLRQKTAWALAQICAVGASNFNSTALSTALAGGPVNEARYLGITSYYDIFVKNAFKTYRRVVGEVTYHPIMGDWLSFRGNRRAQNGSAPDENYAREVMQLFTVGLDLLNDSGEQQTNSEGLIPTYDATDIREYAQIFTGLGYGYGTLNTTSTAYSPYTGASGGLNGSVKYGVPMRMAPAEHDRSSKWLLGGTKLPSIDGSVASIDVGITSGTSHTEASANAEIDAALDGLVAHQSCAPFIVNRLILRLVKSNPSKAYMNRVVQVFKNNGSGVRGDLKAVVKAILLDPEAWQPIRVQYQRSPSSKIIVSTMGTEDSRLQEPVLNYTRFMRYFKSVAAYQKSTDGTNTYTAPITVLTNEFRLGTRLTEFAQSPYETPTVFNFYNADYQPRQIVGIPLSSRIPNGAAVAPEFEILNAITAPRTANFYRDRIAAGNRNEGHLSYNSASTSQAGNVVTTPTVSTRCLVTYDFTAERALSTNAAGIDALLERLDLYLCGGTLSNAYKARLRSALIDEVTAAGASVDNTEALNIARGAILAIMTSPSFLVTE